MGEQLQKTPTCVSDTGSSLISSPFTSGSVSFGGVLGFEATGVVPSIRAR